jgi:hypothetical protein
MPENKGLDRGGSLGQEGELSPDGGSPEAKIDHAMDLERDKQQQRGGQGKEPDLDKKHKIQPTHPVD